MPVQEQEMVTVQVWWSDQSLPDTKWVKVETIDRLRHIVAELGGTLEIADNVVVESRTEIVGPTTWMPHVSGYNGAVHVAGHLRRGGVAR